MDRQPAKEKRKIPAQKVGKHQRPSKENDEDDEFLEEPDASVSASLRRRLFLRARESGSAFFRRSMRVCRYYQALHRFLKRPDVTAKLNSWNIDVDEIASHSMRKGARTFCSSGTTHPPSKDSIEIRGGWARGTIDKIYSGHGNPGDCYVGRVLAGHDVMSADFAAICAHFVGCSPGELSVAVEAAFPHVHSFRQRDLSWRKCF